jgi:hypothetical protein
MMQVAPMPDKPPFMNGLTAFQVALSFRDMTMRSCGACGDVLRADLGADAFSFATERYRPNRRPQRFRHLGCAPRVSRADFLASLWRVEENHGLLTLGESKNENPSFARFSVDTARPGRARFRETFEKKITRVALFV